MSAIEGLDELNIKLEGLSASVLSAAAEAMQRGLLSIAGEAKARVQPISPEVANNITTSLTIEGEKIEGQVISQKEYGIFIEMGTGPRGEENHAGVSPEVLAGTTYRSDGWTYYDENLSEFVRTQGMPARPHMYPAYTETRDDVKREVEEGIKGGLKGR